MDIDEATSGYEAWLRDRMKPADELFRAQLDDKHEKMRDGGFPFLRATFYRWAALWPVCCPELASRKEDRLLAVGDLHLENFGTWRDAEARLVWGINDFDEACGLPFTNDLVRLATSAFLAGDGGLISLPVADACAALLAGYRTACETGGNAIILDSGHDALRDAVAGALESDKPKKFWAKLQVPDDYPAPGVALPLPEEVRTLLAASLPEGAEEVEYRVVRKSKGLGSLGHPRYLALAQWNGGYVAREAKALVPSAVQWLADPASDIIRAGELVTGTPGIRSLDPAYQVHGSWALRAVSPDAMKVDLEKLGPAVTGNAATIELLLQAMGKETANLHLSQQLPAADLLQRLEELGAANPDWLPAAATAMATATKDDWMAWKEANPPTQT